MDFRDVESSTLLNTEETETLEFTNDRPFYTSQRRSKLSINQTELYGKM